MKQLLTILIFVLLLLPASTQAETVLRISESLSLDSAQTVNGDYYGATGLAGPISLSGKIEGDALLAGSSITTNGEITGDLFALSTSAQLHAPVNDDVRIVAGEVTLADYVGGDVFVVGGMLKVLSTAEIAGSVFFYGGEAEINGTVGGSIFGTSQNLRIDGPVGGSVDVEVSNSLVIGGKADISGDIKYTSSKELLRAQDAVVVGDIVKQTRTHEAVSLSGLLLPMLMLAFLTLILFVVLRNHLPGFVNYSLKSFTKNGLLGLAAILSTPLLVGLLLVTVIGSLVGVLLLLAMLSLCLFSFALVPIFLGKLINQHLFKTNGLTLLSTILGIIALEVTFMIPFIGPAAVFALLSIVLGSILMKIYRSLV